MSTLQNTIRKMVAYTYTATVRTDDLGPVERGYDLHTPAHRHVRWEGTFEHNGKTYHLGSNCPVLGRMTSVMLNTLRGNGVSVALVDSTMKGGFDIEYDGSSTHCEVEMVKHSYHFKGGSYDRWGGNYLDLYHGYLESLGAENPKVTQNQYEVTVNTLPAFCFGGPAPVANSNNSNKVTQATPEPEPVDDDDNSSVGSDIDGFDLFGDF